MQDYTKPKYNTCKIVPSKESCGVFGDLDEQRVCIDEFRCIWIKSGMKDAEGRQGWGELDLGVRLEHKDGLRKAGS